ncbi:MAG: GDYXXLXY domain-containing protein [Saprospiraceae bacterium]|nr:GDYXXLXY domain-containing protein [Saprospiraceae bacterium]
MILSKFILPLFLVMCFAQWFVTGRMVFQHEDVLKTGTAFSFKTAPIDPNDPFRGKYVYLNYDFTELVADSIQLWHQGDKVFVTIKKNNEGFAIPDKIHKEAPVSETNYVQATINYVSNDGSKKMGILYPFDRFYVEEFVAPMAEKVYVESQIDSTNTSFALVKIKKGQAVIEDVFINDTSIIQIVKERMNKEVINK